MKKLKPQHREAVRRLVAGESQTEVAEEMGLSPTTLSGWMKDPRFLSELHDVEERALSRLLDSQERLDALAIIQDTAAKAAQLCENAVQNGLVGDEAISPGLRLKSAWDILDRAGYKATEKREVGIYDIADLVRLAEEKYAKHKVIEVTE